MRRLRASKRITISTDSFIVSDNPNYGKVTANAMTINVYSNHDETLVKSFTSQVAALGGIYCFKVISKIGIELSIWDNGDLVRQR